ncbi:MAG: fumarate hydratase [Deltaproteobacteria bacterium HGW-Deltaproteobacteria-19]|jgi:fumarate hydratase subunit beta|nr:MAG: fumarate hydratase [Deltaproteobacteria bacterium HGW-Deltaproteobacteria-19]
MMQASVISLRTPLTADVCRELSAGDRVLLSGSVLTARDAAHRRFADTLRRGGRLPVSLQDETIFYAAPTPTPPGRVIGSIGPTTSGRMDPYTTALLGAGLRGMIGKGRRSPEVVEAIRKRQGVYFAATGGVAAVTSRCIRSVSLLAYEDLGPEAVLRLEIVNFPLIVVNDACGGDLYEMVLKIARTND